MLRTPGSPWSSRRRPCTLVERLAAVGIVAQPDRQGQLGKADGRHVGLVGWWAGSGIGAGSRDCKSSGLEGSSSALRFTIYDCVMSRLIRTDLGSSSLIVHVLHSPPPPTRTAL